MEIITVKIHRDDKLVDGEVKAERIPGKNNFYVWQIRTNKYKAYSLTIIPQGGAISYFKYKKDAIELAKVINDKGFDLDKEFGEIAGDKEFMNFMREYMDNLNSNSNYIRVGKKINNFPV